MEQEAGAILRRATISVRLNSRLLAAAFLKPGIVAGVCHQIAAHAGIGDCICAQTKAVRSFLFHIQCRANIVCFGRVFELHRTITKVMRIKPYVIVGSY